MSPSLLGPPIGEQVKVLSKLTTHLILIFGTAGGTTSTLTWMVGGLEATVPMLSLSAEGLLVMARVVVPVGKVGTVLSGGPGAAIILQRANAAGQTPSPAPGPGQWGPAQESMSARSRAYQEQITGHSADEAYWVGGVGRKSGGGWFKNSGAQALVDQARRQLGIDIVYTPPLQGNVPRMPESIQRMETYYAGAYWGPRKESAEACAKRVEAMLAALASHEPSFCRWFKQARSLKESLKRPLEPTHAALHQWLQRGAMRSDGGMMMEELGYSVSAWNGERDEYDDSDFHVSCGGYSKRVNNACVFKLPSRGPNAERVLTTQVLAGLVRSMAIAWEPDWGVAMSHIHRDVVKPPQAEQGPYVAWITYLARRRGKIPPLPTPVCVEPVEDKGTLIVLTPERFTAANPVHVELAQRVRGLLDRAGLLHPVTV